ncbi:MAG: hypothetical protein HOV81_01785 [Kofleriaceae bacterium]|nr:hypothetical protein [Kofleriaceae bacterium]
MNGIVRIDLDSRIMGPLMLLIGLIPVVGGIGVLVVGSPVVPVAGGIIAFVFGGLIALVGLGGIVGLRTLLVDVPGNAIHLRQGRSVVTVPLDELAVPTITTYHRPRVGAWFKLATPSFPDVVLVDHYKRAHSEKLAARLASLRAQALLRRVLATAPLEDAGPFRASPELQGLLAQAVPDESLRSAALAALASDHDSAIAQRAASLTGSM